MNTKDFDLHLDNYRKIMELKEINLRIFYKQFRLCCLPLEKYQYFKQNSRHLQQLNLGL